MSQSSLLSLLLVMMVAALAPIVSRLVPGRPPQVLFLIVGGVLIGPHVLGFADSADIELLAGLGLGFLFLLAGHELDPQLLREKAGTQALIAWTISAVAAVAVVGGLEAIGFVHAFVPVSIALTTTALGTLLPILREQNMLGGRFGRFVFAAGAVGELFPILAISLFLGAYKTWWEALIIASIAGLAFVLAWLTRSCSSGTRVAAIIGENRHATSQSTLRITVVLLVGLLLITQQFGVEAALGAFFAGMVLRRTSTGAANQRVRGEAGRRRLRLLHSGLLRELRNGPRRPVHRREPAAAAGLLRAAPGGARRARAAGLPEDTVAAGAGADDVPDRDGAAAAGRPVGDRDESGVMLPENAAALVGAGVLSVAIFPLVATRIHRPADETVADEAPPTEAARG